jgi:hypothetical protein
LRATAPPTRFPVTQAAREGAGPGATYTTTRSDLCGFPSRRTRRMSRSPSSSDAELRPALLPPAPDDRPSRARSHPCPEPVGSLAAACAWLVRALHGGK